MRAVTVREYGGTPAVAEIRCGGGSPVCSDQMALYQEVLPVRTPFREVPAACRILIAAAFMLGAIARDTLGDPDAAQRAQPARHVEALSRGEVRVLRYLQTNLSAREIAGELSISVNTVKTHQRHLYRKLGARSRTQAVGQARAVGLLRPSSRATTTESQRYEYQR